MRSFTSCALFESGDITHVDGSVDPIRDIEVINTELILADLEAVTSVAKNVKSDPSRMTRKPRQSLRCVKTVCRTSMR